MFPGRNVYRPDDAVGAVDGGFLAVERGLPTRVVDISHDDKAGFGHIGGEGDVVEGVGSDEE